MPIEDVIPLNRVSLLGGVRDAGKTRFIIPAMLAWTNRPPWAYVAADRPRADAEDTILDMGFQLSDVPLVSAYGRNHKDWRTLIDQLARMDPRPEIVIIEAFQYLCDSMNRHKMVHEFMNRVDAFIEPSRDFPKGLSIVGMTGGSKKSMRDRYPDPTMRIPGAATWVERASTVLLIESASKDQELTNPERVLYVCQKNKLRQRLDGAFDAQNRLVFPNL